MLWLVSPSRVEFSLLWALVVTLSEKASTIQYGFKKLGTDALVFSQTLAHWNSKKEKKTKEQKKKVRREE